MKIYTSEMWLESREFPFFSAYYPFDNGEIIEPHEHEFIELVYVAQGKGVHKYRGDSYPISAGDVFIIEPNVEHSYEATDDTLAVYNVLFMPYLVAVELESLFKFTPFVDFFYVEPLLRKYSDFQSHLILDHQEKLEINFLLLRLIKEFKDKPLGYQIVIRTQLIELLVFLSRCYTKHRNQSLPSLRDDEHMIQMVCQFIGLHHSQPLTLTQISQLCGMSHTQFSMKFKQYAGLTFIEYRNRIRISTAEDLLANTAYKIVTIAETVGFEDLSFFNKSFKELTGKSPSQFRKEARA